MKQRGLLIASLLMSILLLSSCDNGKFWGERKISKIEGQDGSIKSFGYDDMGRLSHYSYIRLADSLNGVVGKIYYDVNIEYTDTAVVVAGMMPYQTYEQNGYKEGVAIYKLGKDNMAIYCKTTHMIDNEEGVEEANTVHSEFGYANKQLMLLSVGYNENRFYYEDCNRTYNYGANGPALVSTFVDYKKEVNKTCLMGSIQEHLHQHEPMFYARMLGLPSKNLVSKHVQGMSGAQVVYDYEYTLDAEGYVTNMTVNRSSTTRIFGSDLLAKSDAYTISYVNESTDGK